jgi:predicted transcriptional regulator
MLGYTITASVDKAVADRLETLAGARQLPAREVAGQAIELYLALPDDLRGVLHNLASNIDQGDTPFIMKDVIRSLHGMATRRRNHDLDAIGHDLLP